MVTQVTQNALSISLSGPRVGTQGGLSEEKNAKCRPNEVLRVNGEIMQESQNEPRLKKKEYQLTTIYLYTICSR